MAKRACPICHKAVSEKHAPFCSKRCADLDLGRWLKGEYTVPVVEEDDVPDETGEDAETPH
jgi:uncharacterized protein